MSHLHFNEDPSDFDHGSLEDKFEMCRRRGSGGLMTFVEAVHQKRERKQRQFDDIVHLQRRKSVEMAQPETEQVWAECAKRKILETDDRLRVLEDQAISELQNMDY
ncbi:hypothetical protein HDE_04460 [Halotydeus destructor]|nr:hypothetical protein HDE_04460 [Halotydeus destructor]